MPPTSTEPKVTLTGNAPHSLGGILFNKHVYEVGGE